MNSLQVLAAMHTNSLGDTVAFSALPDAPVLPDRPVRPSLLRALLARASTRPASATRLAAIARRDAVHTAAAESRETTRMAA